MTVAAEEYPPPHHVLRDLRLTVEHRPELSSVATEEPLAVALVELEEGVRMMSNVVGCPAADVAVGLPVAVTWEPLSDGRHLPLFEPAD